MLIINVIFVINVIIIVLNEINFAIIVFPLVNFVVFFIKAIIVVAIRYYFKLN